MSSEAQVMGLVNRFREVLDARRNVLECFSAYGVQLEGWLKGELLYFLHTEKLGGRLYDFEREVSFEQSSRRKIDLKITDNNGHTMWVELKHWLVGDQKGTRYGAGFYLKDPSSVGIRPDVEKLKRVNGGKYVLTLATANPGMEGWSTGVEEFNRKFPPLRIVSMTDPKDFPSQYFLGLLSVE